MGVKGSISSRSQNFGLPVSSNLRANALFCVYIMSERTDGFLYFFVSPHGHCLLILCTQTIFILVVCIYVWRTHVNVIVTFWEKRMQWLWHSVCSVKINGELTNCQCLYWRLWQQRITVSKQMNQNRLFHLPFLPDLNTLSLRYVILGHVPLHSVHYDSKVS